MVVLGIGGVILYNAKTIDDIESDVVNVENNKFAEKQKWKKFVSDKGFIFEIPNSWNCNYDEGGRSICISFDTQKKFNEVEKLNIPAYVPYDLVIYVHDKTVEEYLALDGDNIDPKKIVLGNQDAYEYIMPGYAGNFTVITEFDGGTLELSFGKSMKEDLEDNELHILKTFQFN